MKNQVNENRPSSVKPSDPTLIGSESAKMSESKNSKPKMLPNTVGKSDASDENVNPFDIPMRLFFVGLCGVYDSELHVKWEKQRGVAEISSMAPACSGLKSGHPRFHSALYCFYDFLLGGNVSEERSTSTLYYASSSRLLAQLQHSSAVPRKILESSDNQMRLDDHQTSTCHLNQSTSWGAEATLLISSNKDLIVPPIQSERMWESINNLSFKRDFFNSSKKNFAIFWNKIAFLFIKMS